MPWGKNKVPCMLPPRVQWIEAIRERFHRHALENELLDLASRLPYEPECRCAYQRLLDEHLQLASRSPYTCERTGPGVTPSTR